MESILEDIPKGQSGFNPFIDPAQEIEEPPEAENPQEEAPEIPDVAQEVEEPTPDPLPEQEEETGEELPEVPAAEEAPAPEALPNEPEAETEVIYNQVEGPKVEVVTVKDEVRKIIVHLAPDNILEIDCEY